MATQNFSIIQVDAEAHTDSDGVDVAQTTITSDFESELTDSGTFNVTNVITITSDPLTVEKELVVKQPWNPLPDGTRADWTDLAEAVAWFKEINHDITGE
tara:strand:+ start:12512 stop:12811 length:300 start_codon:yes stop_codon:yes gene_type:complete